MNRKKILTLLTFLSLQCFLFAGSTTLSLSNNAKTWKLSLITGSEYIRYGFTVKRNDDGLYSITAAPFASVQYKGFRFGELKFSNIAQILTAEDNMYSTADFLSQRIKNVYTPSEKPKFSGFSYSGKNFDIFALTPAINPQGPAGIGGIVHVKNIGLGGAVFDYGKETEKYGKRFASAIVSADSYYKTDTLSFSSSSFVRTSAGKSFGIIHETGSDILLKSRKYMLYASFRHPANTEKSEIIRLKASVQHYKCSYGIFYSSTLGSKPVYGGESQKKEIIMEFFSSIDRINLKSSSEIKYTESGGITSKTTYTAVYSLSSSAVSAQIVHDRKKGNLDSWNIQFTDSKCRLRIKDGKLMLTYRFIFMLGETRIRFLISQDRTFTVSARLTTK